MIGKGSPRAEVGEDDLQVAVRLGIIQLDVDRITACNIDWQRAQISTSCSVCVHCDAGSIRTVDIDLELEAGRDAGNPQAPPASPNGCRSARIVLDAESDAVSSATARGRIQINERDIEIVNDLSSIVEGAVGRIAAGVIGQLERIAAHYR